MLFILYPCRQSRVLEGQARCILHDEGVWRLQAIRYVISSAVLGLAYQSRRATKKATLLSVTGLSSLIWAHKVVVAAHVLVLPLLIVIQRRICGGLPLQRGTYGTWHVHLAIQPWQGHAIHLRS